MAKGKIAQQLADEISGILDMSPESRMARAREMGFDTENVYYHGTSAEFDEFDPEKGGSVYGIEHDRGLSFFTSDRDEAAYNADQAHEALGGNPIIMENYIGLKNPLVIDSKGRNPVNFLDSKKEQIKYDLETKKNENEESYDGVIVINNETGERAVAVADPSLIRSTKAAFDPSKKHSRNLLAGGLPIGAGTILAGGSLSPSDASARILPPTQDVGSIRAPVNNIAATAADLAGGYNRFRQNRLHPLANIVLPVGELPEDLWRKRAYGQDVSFSDYLKAGLGML